MIVNVDAVVLTALHIVDGATEIHISFADGTRTNAVVAGSNSSRDIAVLIPYTPPSSIVPATTVKRLRTRMPRYLNEQARQMRVTVLDSSGQTFHQSLDALEGEIASVIETRRRPLQ